MMTSTHDYGLENVFTVEETKELVEQAREFLEAASRYLETGTEE